MRTPLAEPFVLKEKQSPTARRRARLFRGADRFVTAVTWDGVFVRHSAVVTLTTASPDVAAVQGRFREFSHALRKRWPGIKYFAWLEIQKRGAAHYHVIIPNQPLKHQGFHNQWVQYAWRLGHTSIVRLSGKLWREQAAGYVRNYAKKMGNKSYQQDYDAVPPTIRTFMSHRLGYELELLDEHRDRYEAVWSPDGVEVVAQLQHVNVRCCRKPETVARRGNDSGEATRRRSARTSRWRDMQRHERLIRNRERQIALELQSSSRARS